MYTFSLFHSIIFFSINLNSPSYSVDYYLPTRLKRSFPAKAYLYVKEKGVFALDRKIHLTLDHNARFFTCSGMGGGGWDVSSEEEVRGCNIWGMCNLLYSCTLQQLSVGNTDRGGLSMNYLQCHDLLLFWHGQLQLMPGKSILLL